jgi:hypothetical protein
MSDFATALATGVGAAAIGSITGDSAGKQYRYWRKQMIRADRMQRDTWKWMNSNQLQLRVEDGRKAGLSPLASIGSAGAQMPALQAGGMSPESGGRYADIIHRAILAGHQATERKTDAETRYINMMTDLAIDGHYRRNRITTRNPTKDANTDKPSATIAADTDIDDWEPGDIQLLSEEMSQSFESITSTLATAAINAGLYGEYAIEKIKEKFPRIKETVINRVQELIDDYWQSDEIPSKIEASPRLRKPSKSSGSPSRYKNRRDFFKAN